MADVFVSHILQVVRDKLISVAVEELARRWNVITQLEKMNTVLLKVHAVLDDAEQKQITNIAVSLWLNDLKYVAYDLEDLVDEFETESLRRRVEVDEARTTNSNVKVWIQNASFCLCDAFSWVPKILLSSLCPSVVSFKCKIASKLSKITETLERIAKEKDEFGLSEGIGGNSSTVYRPGPPTTSLVNKSSVFGREEDMEKIIKLLQSDAEPSPSDDDDGICVIPIAGMGGVGKTTLVQLLYNDERVNELFNLKAWTYVSSEEFDLVRVTQAILDSFTTNTSQNFKELQFAVPGSATNTLHHPQQLDPLQVKMREILSGKKFLLVLDDIWSINYRDWDTLKKPLRAGASGSKIIVTTRNIEVLSMMMHSDGTYYHLNQLSDEDCWSLFSHHAFGSRTPDAYPELKEIGNRIVKKCQGLPLVAVTLGGLLRSVVNVNEWEGVLNSELWDLPAGKSDILPALRLSHHHLPAHLKRCFAYCAIIPKGYLFLPRFLGNLWIAEGFVKPEQNKKN